MSAPRHRLFAATTLLVASCDGARAQSPTRAAADHTIVGHVLGQDGEPVRAAEVWVTAADAPDVVVRRTRTDGEGTFLLGRLASPAVIVHARAPGMTTAALDASTLGRGTSIAGDLRLWDARTLRGRLLDERGKPIAGASLIATKDFARVPLAPIEGTTDAAGHFELPGVPIGDCVLRAIAPSFVCIGHTFHDWIDECADLRLQRGEGVQLCISVEGLPPDAMAATHVHLRAVAGGSCRMPRAIECQRLDAQGTCAVKGLPVAEWTVSMEHPEYRFASSIRVPRSADPDPLRFLAMRRGRATVSGQVLIEGRPLVSQPIRFHPGPEVTNQPLQAVTDELGWFEFSAPLQIGDRFLLELAGPDLVIDQSKPRRTPGSHDLGRLGLYEGAVQAEPMQLTATLATFLRGRVVDRLGRAVPFAAVEVQQQLQSMEVVRAAFRPKTTWRTFARTTSGADGTYVVGGLHRSPLPVRLRAAGNGAIGATEPFSIDENSGNRDIHTELPGRIEGFLSDEYGDALVGAPVVLIGERPTAALTDYRGGFVFVGVAPGTHQLAVQRGNSTTTASDEFELKGGEIVRIDLH